MGNEAPFDWKNPDYGPVYAARIARLKRIRETPGMLAGLKEFYKTHPVEFITCFGMTFDPRNVEVDRPAVVPFVLFPKQVEFIQWLYDRWRGREDGLAEKSRDMGVSWLCVAFAVWMITFWPGTVVGFGSRKEEYVDKLGDPKSLFWKVRAFIDLLPVEFRPGAEKFDSKVHAPHMRIINPENGSTIVGEAGDNIGRGNRASVYIKDEAQPLTARILTPFGWQTMRDMRVGSQVIGADGAPHVVRQIKDSVAQVYRLVFSDGTTVEASHNHLWAVRNVIGKKRDVVVRTHEIAATFAYESPRGHRQYRWRVPVTKPVQFASGAALPLHPYIVGVLLGDGSVGSGTIRFTSADKQVVEEVQSLLPVGSLVTGGDGCIQYRIVSGVGRGRGKRGDSNVIKAAVRAAGIEGMRSADKHIPSIYLFASVADRLALLQGLMDTDGSGSGGVASFHSSAKQLSDDVRFLVESLGGTATQNVKPDARGYRDMWVLHIMLPMPVFRLTRKLSALRPRKHPAGRTVVGIEAIGEREVRCITVDGDLYLTDHCVVTHNSAFYDRPEAIDAALSQTANCKIDVSTPNGSGNPFYRKAHGGKIKKFVFDWTDDPRKDQAWYDKQVATLDPVIVAQEIDRDYESSVTNAFIPGVSVLDAMARGPADVVAHGRLRVGIDVARFGDDKSVILFRRGRVVLKLIELSKSDITQVAGRARAEIVAYGERPEQIAVDTIGLGAGVADILRAWYPDTFDRRSEKRIKTVVDVNSALVMDDGVNYNLRAAMWSEMREWIKTASLPNDPELKSDLTALRYLFKGGLLLIESKEDAKRRGIKSPDRADALALTFAVPTLAEPERKPIKARPFATYDAAMGALG